MVKRTGGFHPAPALALLAGIALGTDAQAQAAADRGRQEVRHDPRDYIATPVRIDVPPRLDGRLDERVWADAAVLGDFIQQEPREGEPASEATTVRLLYTQTSLYLGFECVDSDPGGPIVNELRWDGDFEGDDRIEIILDTFNNDRDAYVFRFTPLGAQWDAQVRDEGASVNVAWDGVWYVRTGIEPWGWAAEVEIPFSTLRFPTGAEQRWSFNIQRVIRRKNEDTYWTPVPRGLGAGPDVEGKYRLAYAGHLEGLRGIRPGSRLELKPYGLAGATRASVGRGEDSISEAGLDARYMLLDNLSADLTLNTDFAQVEADQEQINLDRFPLFFPEKREFFLEGRDIFAFGQTEFNAAPPFQLFYSRRIGLARAHTGDFIEVPMEAGLKVTGKTGPYTVGALAVRTGDRVWWDPFGPIGVTTVLPATTTVLRLSRDVLERSRVGAMYLGRATSGTGEVYSAGGIDVDFSLMRNTRVSGFVASSGRKFDAPMVASERGMAGALNYEWHSDLWGLNLSNLYIDDDWAPDLGFVQRTGIWKHTAEFNFSPRPNLPGVRQVAFFFDTDHYLRPGGPLESRKINPGIWIDLENGGTLVGGVTDRFEDVPGSFEIGTVVVVPAGIHRWRSGFLQVNTDRSQPLGTSTLYVLGNYYHARRRTLLSSIWLRPGPHASAEVMITTNRISDSSDTFRGDLVAARLIWTPSTRLTTKLFAQLNTATDVGGVNGLISWRYRPRSYLYLVYNERFEKTSAWHGYDRALLAKLVYLWNL